MQTNANLLNVGAGSDLRRSMSNLRGATAAELRSGSFTARAATGSASTRSMSVARGRDTIERYPSQAFSYSVFKILNKRNRMSPHAFTLSHGSL